MSRITARFRLFLIIASIGVAALPVLAKPPRRTPPPTPPPAPAPRPNPAPPPPPDPMVPQLREIDSNLWAYATVNARAVFQQLGAATSPQALVAEGRILEQEKKYSDAVNRFDRAAAGAADAAPLIYKGEALLHNNQADAARAAFGAARTKAQALVDANPQNAEALYQLGVAQQRLGQHDAAIATLEKARQLAPSDARLPYQMGATRFLQQQWQPAVDLCSRAIEQNPQLAFAYYVRGAAASQVGRKDLTVNDLRRFLELAPGAPEADRARRILASIQG